MNKLSAKVVENVVSEVAGEDVVSLVKVLKNRKNVSEFKLAESLKAEINRTRNMLYRLYDNNLVSFTRKKDKKKGWYIYYWTFNMQRVGDLVKNLKLEKYEKIKTRLERENNSHFFACDSECIRLDFDQATDFKYTCPECGTLLHQEENEKTVSELKKQLKELEKDLKSHKLI